MYLSYNFQMYTRTRHKSKQAMESLRRQCANTRGFAMLQSSLSKFVHTFVRFLINTPCIKKKSLPMTRDKKKVQVYITECVKEGNKTTINVDLRRAHEQGESEC